MDFRTIFNFAFLAVLMLDCIIDLAMLKVMDKIASICSTEQRRHMGSYPYLGRKQEQEQSAPKGIDFPNSNR